MPSPSLLLPLQWLISTQRDWARKTAVNGRDRPASIVNPRPQTDDTPLDFSLYSYGISGPKAVLGLPAGCPELQPGEHKGAVGGYRKGHARRSALTRAPRRLQPYVLSTGSLGVVSRACRRKSRRLELASQSTQRREEARCKKKKVNSSNSSGSPSDCTGHPFLLRTSSKHQSCTHTQPAQTYSRARQDFLLNTHYIYPGGTSAAVRDSRKAETGPAGALQSRTVKGQGCVIALTERGRRMRKYLLRLRRGNVPAQTGGGTAAASCTTGRATLVRRSPASSPISRDSDKVTFDI